MAEAKGLKITCRRTDLPKNQRIPVQDAVRALWQREVRNTEGDAKRTKLARWGEFARGLKASLDKSLEPHWHVLVGNQVGFACKKRERTMGMWLLDGTAVVIWKSPGIEPPAPPEEAKPEEAKSEAVEGSAASASDSQEPSAEGRAAAAKVKVLYPAEVEAGSGEEQVAALLRQELEAKPTEDPQELAQSLRKRLMKELGPIWHVIVGADFAADFASDRKNYVRAAVGKLQIVCFQHKQFVEKKVDIRSLAKALPYLLFAIFSFSYMTLHNVCQEGVSTDGRPVAAWVRSTFCHEGWDKDVGILGACALAGLFFARKANHFLPKQKQKAA